VAQCADSSDLAMTTRFMDAKGSHWLRSADPVKLAMHPKGKSFHRSRVGQQWPSGFGGAPAPSSQNRATLNLSGLLAFVPSS
jgi:hypothetical protein